MTFIMGPFQKQNKKILHNWKWTFNSPSILKTFRRIGPLVPVKLVTVLWYVGVYADWVWSYKLHSAAKLGKKNIFSFQVLSEHFDIKHWNVSKVLQLDSSAQHKECKQPKKSCFMGTKNIYSQYHLEKASCCFNSLPFYMDKTDQTC